MLVTTVLATLVAAMASIAASGGVVHAPPAAAQDADDAAGTRQALVAERESAQANLAAVEAELQTSAAELTRVDGEVVAAQQARSAAVAARQAAEAAREQPLRVRRAIAIETYVAGDPYAASILDEILEAGSSIDGIRERALYSSVVDWAQQTLARLDREIEQASAAIDEIDGRLPQLEAERNGLLAGQADQIARRDALQSQIDDLARRIELLSRAPLTGLPLDTVEARPTLIVKIDNVKGARPQTGLNQADIVVEERVEGGLTRFAALFQSTGSDPVGPVRSARTSDVHLFANLGAPLFAYSGANIGVGSAVAASNLVDVGAGTHRDLYQRVSDRRAPHNLFTSTSALWAAASGGEPVPLFTYRAAGDPLGAGARPVGGVDLDYGSTTAAFVWNGSGWVRSSDGQPHPDSSGAAVAPANVVVRFTSYVPSPADGRSPEAVVTGSGELWVLTAGHAVVGRWEQASAAAPTRWLDANGEPISLTPGRTWIVMPDPGGAALR